VLQNIKCVFLCFIDRASRYNSLLMTNLMHFLYQGQGPAYQAVTHTD